MTMKCPNCGSVNPDTDAFCSSCGRDMMATLPRDTREWSRNCVSCGRSIPWSAAVCPYCGRDYRLQAYQAGQEQHLSTGIRILLYIMSLLIPIAGFIVGAIYYTRSEAEYKHVGKICIILGLVSILITVGLAVLLYVMVLGFGGIQYTTTPAATYAKSTVTGGWRINMISITKTDVPWNDIRVQLTDGTTFSEWETRTADLDGGYAVTAPYAAELMSTLSVTLTVTDISGNGFVNCGDYFIVTASPEFSSATIYLAALVYEPTGERIGTGITFTG